jgi:hypothetical protein
MNAHDAIMFSIETASNISMGYIGDLTDADLLRRPAPGCNHINWQLGHLIVAENHLIAKELPGSVPALPKGFAEKYTSETSKSDDPKAFCSKEELLGIHKQQREATLAALAKTSATELDRKCEGWAPNLGAVFAGAAGEHWLMHVGQWAVVRRQLGKPPLF